jgi:oligoribonuclease NrnB/cAMP/cGMP phosphodiesterase (DHH superfamily)
MEDEESLQPTSKNYVTYGSIAFLTSAMAAYAMIRRGNYRAALLLYRRTGGGGLNIYKQQENGQSKRLFAIDYHPFWDSASKQNKWRLHYHRGENQNQIKKHRPYEGGW